MLRGEGGEGERGKPSVTHSIFFTKLHLLLHVQLLTHRFRLHIQVIVVLLCGKLSLQTQSSHKSGVGSLEGLVMIISILTVSGNAASLIQFVDPR